MALKVKRVLYISYNGMLDPLGQSQVIPYLRELSRHGLRFSLLSFERLAAGGSDQDARCENLRHHLAQYNIEWHWLRYHQKPSLPATFYDVLAGVQLGRRLVMRNRVEMVHARCGIPAAIALTLKRRFKLKMICDVRGLIAEEYAEAGHWREGNIPYRLMKTLERQAFAAADGVVTLTEAIWPVIREWEGLRGRNVPHQVIPCCTDLQRFRFDPAARARRRAELNLDDNFVLVYSGSIGSWYLTDLMADFFLELLKQRPGAHFLWLTPGSHAAIKLLMQERGIKASQFTVRSVESAEVASYLSASDAGVAFYKPGFSKLATSPVKIAEYLACGLPIIINAGIGDSDALATREQAGALVSDFTPQEYVQAVTTVLGMRGDIEALRCRTREVAGRLFDLRGVGLERYVRLYEEAYR